MIIEVEMLESFSDTILDIYVYYIRALDRVSGIKVVRH